MAQHLGTDDPALHWAVRTADPAFEDWDAFTDWLEADPSHAARYHAIADDVATMAALLPRAPAPVADAAPGGRPSIARRRWIGGLLAASVIGSVGYLVVDRLPQPMTIETAPGVDRTIALADGSTITLNGASRIVLDRRNPRVATLDRGEALFWVRHDATKSFRVSVGERQIVDLGTRFSVARDGETTRVAVSEGAIAFDPDHGDTRLHAGQALTASDSTQTVVVRRVDPAAVGAWRGGLLLYPGTPLRLVAADLSRGLGLTIVAAADVAERPFQGVIALDRIRRDPAALGPLLGVSLTRAGDRWTMTERR